MRRTAGPIAVTAALFAQGCAVPPRQLPPVEPLPALPVEQVRPPPAPAPEPVLFPTVPELQGHGDGPPLTLSASNVDIRTLIPAIAETMGISIVLGPEVQGRITINLEDIPALVALRTVLDAAGVGVIGSGPRTALWEPVVFYTLPINIAEASAEVVQARFGVSRMVAETATSSN